MLETLLTLGVPGMAGLVLTLLRAIATQRPISLDTTRDIALDMTFLALGAAGSVFHSPKLQSRMGNDVVGALAGLIVVDLFVAAVLLYLQRFNPTVTVRFAWLNLILGTFSLTLVGVVIYSGSWEFPMSPLVRLLAMLVGGTALGSCATMCAILLAMRIQRSAARAAVVDDGEDSSTPAGSRAQTVGITR